ncbi:hypothetical protein RB11631 [Rhodopirellula baltica SH 1]|uniref:Helix-turn-helix domain-containing protein n=2 Tax=Rhodopirellula baltica TaxID=265606 RepID=Q7UE26_RHOBA|nr:hypothetical protein RB11631 [Rhodopirellula baltica SH 1]
MRYARNCRFRRSLMIDRDSILLVLGVCAVKKHNPTNMDRLLKIMLSEKEVAQKLNVSQSTVKRLCKKFGFPTPVWVGSQKRWLEEMVDQWIAKQAALQNRKLGA